MQHEKPLESYAGQRSIKLATELAEKLNEKTFLGTDTRVAYRVINHWEQTGLIDNHRGEKPKWRRYSFVEFVWIRMIDEMRSVGLKLSSIKAVKEELMTLTPVINLWSLMWSIGDLGKVVSGNLSEEDQADFQKFFEQILSDPPEGQEELQVSLLQLLIANAIVKRCPIVLVVFPDGDYFWIEEHPEFVLPEEFKDRMSYETHLKVSITGIIKEFLSGDLAFKRIDDLQLLDENETFLLKVLQSGEYESVTVNFRNQKMDSLEMKKSVETTKRVVDVLAEADYQGHFHHSAQRACDQV